MQKFRFSPALPATPAFTLGDAFILLALIGVLFLGVRLAVAAPPAIAGPTITLAPTALPWYALLSTARMTVAYLLALAFSLAYGYVAARNVAARQLLMPLLDVLQSVPILSFLPIVLLSFTAFLPQNLAAELAAIVLIFTSQAWNMTFSFYQSMTTIPNELREAAAVFRLNPWLRFKTLELPFASTGLLWNSVMSWAGGWFFLMASETFRVGDQDFRLPGLGSYLQAAANAGNIAAIILGLATLILVIVLLDQLVWRPLIVWSGKFKIEMVDSDQEPGSWFLELLAGSWLLEQFRRYAWQPLVGAIDRFFQRNYGHRIASPEQQGKPQQLSTASKVVLGALLAAAVYLVWQAVQLLAGLPLATWGVILLAVLATFVRVTVVLALALLWTIPVGVWIGTNQRAANILQPVVQIVASVPATALFPVIVLLLIGAPGGLNLAAVVLLLMGTQWYLLFNVIGGASAIPQDLRNTTALLRLKRADRWRALILPALFPFIITGAITASGGAWNASIVAEYVEFGGQVYKVLGIGALIAEATAKGDYPLLLASTLALVVTVVIINRIFWRRLYNLASERYRME